MSCVFTKLEHSNFGQHISAKCDLDSYIVTHFSLSAHIIYKLQKYLSAMDTSGKASYIKALSF